MVRLQGLDSVLIQFLFFSFALLLYTSDSAEQCYVV